MALTFSERPAFRPAVSHVAVVAHVLGVTSAILVLVWVLHFRGGVNLNSDNPDLVFNVHPLVMYLGFVFIAGEAIMVYKTVWAARNVQKTVHMVLQLVALSFGIFGVYAAFKFHKDSQIPDMYSLHSWLGMCTICFFGLQWLFGFLYFWYPRAPHPTRLMVAPLHASAGVAIFLLTILTAETGFVEKSTQPGAESRLINFTGLFILLFGVVVSLSTALPRVTL